MKRLELTTEKIFFKEFNSIRNKKDIILLLLETIKQLLLNSKDITEFNDFEVIKIKDVLKIVIYIDKMKRIFYCTENKVQSRCFPFNVIFKGDIVEFYYKNDKIDYTKISILNSVFEKSSMINSLNLVDILLEDDGYKNACSNEQIILEELVLFLSIFEDGYLRFDFCDEKNFDIKLHPLHHIDFYYTNSNTFKLGLENEMSMKKNIEIIDIKQKCFNIK